MLARLLRTILLAQAGIGALVGVWLWRSGRSGPWAIGVLAVLLPLFLVVLQSCINAVRAGGTAPVRLRWQALAGEIAAAMRIFVLRQPWTWKPPALLHHKATRARVPVLLVHGYLCNHRVWDLMQKPLRDHGHTLLAIDLEPLFTSIDDYAAPIERAVQQLRAETGAERVALLGHSMGGLAIRVWRQKYGARHVAGIITLGTPHQGTQVKQARLTPNALQMNWQSPWIQNLNAAETPASLAQMRIALSAQDPIVFPQQVQTLGGVEPTVFEGIGHLQLCTDQKVLQWTIAELALL